MTDQTGSPRTCSFGPAHEPWMCTVHLGGGRTSLDQSVCSVAATFDIHPLTADELAEFDAWAEARKGKPASRGMLWALRLRATIESEAQSLSGERRDLTMGDLLDTLRWIVQEDGALPEKGSEREQRFIDLWTLDVERLRARVATLWHFGGEGDACDGSEAMWCQACWDDTASLVDPDTHLGLYREADAELARLSAASEPGEPAYATSPTQPGNTYWRDTPLVQAEPGESQP